jgi:hypothetical protein
MRSMSMKKIALALSMAAAMTACKTNKQADKMAADARAAGYSDGQSAAQANAIKAAGLLTAIYEGIGSGFVDVQLVKFGKDNPNYAVIKVTTAGPSIVFAVDISNYIYGTDYNTYLSANTGFYNLSDNGDGTYRCVSGTCFSYGGAPASSDMVFEKTNGSVKDLEKAAAFAESFKVDRLADGLKSQYGLSEERSIKVAKLATSWEKLSKTRALTNADADAFAKELAGVNFSEIDSAVKGMTEGNLNDMNTIIAKAADVNGTSIENMSSIIMKLFF